jgi:hypothetical protein
VFSPIQGGQTFSPALPWSPTPQSTTNLPAAEAVAAAEAGLSLGQEDALAAATAGGVEEEVREDASHTLPAFPASQINATKQTLLDLSFFSFPIKT